MNRFKKIFAAVMAAAFILTTGMAAGISTEAADSYTVTYRAGNVGRFDTGVLSGISAGTSGQVLDISYTENYVKVKVKANTEVSVLEDVETVVVNALNADDGYELLSSKIWGYRSCDVSKINKNFELILDYGKIVNPAKYIIRYVNDETREQIAPSKIAFGSEGEEISYGILSISGYTTTETAGKIKLSSDASKNVIELLYSPIKTEIVQTETVVNYIYVPGETTYVDGGTTTTVENDESAVTDADNAVPGTVAANGGAVDDGTVIADEDTPAAPGVDDAENGTIIEDEESPAQEKVIEDEETPASGSIGNRWLPVTVGIVCALIIAVACGYLYARGVRRKAENNSGNR